MGGLCYDLHVRPVRQRPVVIIQHDAGGLSQDTETEPEDIVAKSLVFELVFQVFRQCDQRDLQKSRASSPNLKALRSHLSNVHNLGTSFNQSLQRQCVRPVGVMPTFKPASTLATDTSLTLDLKLTCNKTSHLQHRKCNNDHFNDRDEAAKPFLPAASSC